MSNAKLTMFGFDRYFSNNDKSLFDNLTLPAGITKDTLVDNILLRGGEFEVMYSDPDFMRSAIGAWSLKWQPTFKRWVDALAIEYNPLENYDRIEDWTDNTARSEAITSSNELSRNENAAFSQSDSRSIDNDAESVTDKDSLESPPTREITKSAYDSNDYQPQNKEVERGKIKQVDSNNSNESGATDSEGNTVISENGQNDTSTSINNDAVHNGRIHGNIGVTTSQQMLMAELELGYWNIYEKITELFLQEFTIPVYI